MATIFTSHGAPDIIASDNATIRFWAQLCSRLIVPQRFIIVSAHWCTKTPVIGAHLQPPTIHDFGGFPASLYQLHYSAKSDPDYAHLLAQKLSLFNVQISTTQGLDHGAWIPLMAMRPQADIAVIPVSLPMSYSLDQLWQWGQALGETLSPRDLLICSGASTHNLSAIFSAEQDGEQRVSAFRQWLLPNVQQGNREALINYRTQAPDAKWNHPSDEHFRPLFVAQGAAGQRIPAHYLTEMTYRFLAMDHFVWA